MLIVFSFNMTKQRTSAEIKEIVDLFLESANSTLTAHQLGISKERLRQILVKAGINPSQVKQEYRLKKRAAISKMQGLDPEKIAQDFDVPIVEVLKLTAAKPKKRDLTGEFFGYWEVLKPLGVKTQTGYKIESTNNSCFYWECRCKCQMIKAVSERNLVQGKSLGCTSCAARDRNNLNRPKNH